MIKDLPNVKKYSNSLLLMILNIAVMVFTFLSQTINVYRYTLVGAIFEFLWLPWLVMLFILPILSFIFWMREKYSISSLNLYSFFTGLISILLLFFLK
jgi:hypothetical protein